MRVESESGFILHTIPYRETSLLVDIFTLNHGRLRCVAKGFRKPNKKGIAKTLFPYTEHHFQWQGRGELKTLIQADPVQAPVFLRQESLFVGLYINELLYKLLHQNDPHQSLYKFYYDLMGQLTQAEIEQVLSAGAVAQNILNAAHALGYGAIWRTGEMAYDDRVKTGLGLARPDKIVGFIYVGQIDGKTKNLPTVDEKNIVDFW